MCHSIGPRINNYNCEQAKVLNKAYLGLSVEDRVDNATDRSKIISLLLSLQVQNIELALQLSKGLSIELPQALLFCGNSFLEGCDFQSDRELSTVFLSRGAVSFADISFNMDSSKFDYLIKDSKEELFIQEIELLNMELTRHEDGTTSVIASKIFIESITSETEYMRSITSIFSGQQEEKLNLIC
jgi:hypothetical protein